MQWHLSNESNKKELGNTYEVLIEGNSKKSDQEWMGRTSQNKVVVFPKSMKGQTKPLQKGDYVNILATTCTTSTLIGEPV